MQELHTQSFDSPIPAITFGPLNTLLSAEQSRPSGLLLPKSPRPSNMPNLISMKDLYALELPVPKFLVPGLIPTGLVMLAGMSKLGKSWFALDLAGQVASGGTFMGETLEQGNALYIGLEDNLGRLQRRSRLLDPSGNWASDNLETTTEWPVLNVGGIECIAWWLEANPNARLVVIDVIGPVMPIGSGQNDYAFVTSILKPLQKLALEHDICIMFVHHVRKQSGAPEGGDRFARAIGSSAYMSNVDAALMLERDRMSTHATLSITGRDLEEHEIYVDFDPETLRWSRVDATKAGVKAPPLEQQKVLEALESGISKVTDLESYLGKSRTAIQNLLKTLCDQGQAERVIKGEYRSLRGVPSLAETEEATEQSLETYNPPHYSEPDYI